jgi:hypothetical protein
MPDDRMTTDEFDQMRELLRRFAATELDQWVMWRTETAHGPVYVSIKRIPDPGASEGAYDRV